MKRVHYFTGQLLSAEDFQAEQDYHRDKQRRLNLRLHGMGVVSGLHVSANPISANSNEIHVSPGVAIDCYGNEIVIDEPQVIPVPAATSPVWLIVAYTETLTDPVPANGETHTQPSRVEEGFKLEYATDPQDENTIRLARLRWTNERWSVERPFRSSLLPLGLVIIAFALRCLLCSRRR
jgi:hypothetical protein